MIISMAHSIFEMLGWLSLFVCPGLILTSVCDKTPQPTCQVIREVIIDICLFGMTFLVPFFLFAIAANL